MRRIEDETVVRNRSQTYLASAPGNFELLEKQEYELVRAYADAAAFIRSAVANDPTRAEMARNPSVVAEVEAQFARLAEPLEQGGFSLSQPCLFYRFRRT
jgi:3-methyladenine DNA glycosylase Tag